MSEFKDEIWTMRDGTKIAVGDMSESHVRNALRMVMRNHRKLQLKLRQATTQATSSSDA